MWAAQPEIEKHSGDDGRPGNDFPAPTDRLTESHQPRWAPWSLYALAGLCLLFANGRNTIPLATWLAPLLLLRFVRGRRPGRGLLAAWLLLSATWIFQLRGMVPAPTWLFASLAAIYGVFLTLPFVADRLLSPRLEGVTSTLVLPCAWAAVELLQADFTPYGSWGAVAYPQSGNLVLLQLVSVTGIYGISFLVGWFASVGNLVWTQPVKVRRWLPSAVAFTVTMGLVLVLGGARLSTFPPGGETVRVASLGKGDLELIPSPEVGQRVSSGTLTEADLAEIQRRGEQINGDLLARAEREAEAGARIVFWGETNAFALAADAESLHEKARALARRQQIYLGVAAAVWNTDSPTPLENELLLIGPSGDILWRFLKARPVPGAEAQISLRGEGRIPVTDTPYGRLGGAICFDMDFPRLLQQAGKQGVDLMIVPANDWREIDPWHTDMARLRAVEEGFNLVRQASLGLSLAVDYQGRTLGRMDHFATADRVLVSQVPIRGTRTLYARVGDLFAWTCLAGLLVLVVSALRRSRPGAGRGTTHSPSGSRRET